MFAVIKVTVPNFNVIRSQKGTVGPAPINFHCGDHSGTIYSCYVLFVADRVS